MSELSEMFNGQRWLTLSEDDAIVKDSESGGSSEIEFGQITVTNNSSMDLSILQLGVMNGYPSYQADDSTVLIHSSESKSVNVTYGINKTTLDGVILVFRASGGTNVMYEGDIKISSSQVNTATIVGYSTAAYIHIHTSNSTITLTIEDGGTED